MNKTYKVIITATKLNRIARVNKIIDVVQGSTTHIQAKGGERFELHDAQTGISPSIKKIITKRVGNHLHIQFEGSTQPDLIIDNYYDESVLPNELSGVSEEGQVFDYVIGESQDIGALDLAQSGTAEVAGSGMMETLSDIALPLGLALAAGGAGVAFGMSGGGSKKSTGILSLTKPVEMEGGTVDSIHPVNQASKLPNNTPKFSIHSMPKSMTAQLIVDGKAVESILEQDAQGKYYLTPKDPLSEGNHKISYQFLTANGKLSGTSAILDILTDTVIPYRPETQPSTAETTTETNSGHQTESTTGQASTHNTLPNIAIGQIQTGTKPELIVDGKPVDTVVTTDEKGNVTLTPKSPIGEGEHTVTYRVVTPSGRTSSESEPLKLIVDTTPPNAPLFAPDMTPETDEGVSHTDNVTSNLKPHFMIGVVPKGLTAQLVVDGNVVAATVSAPDAQGNVFLTPIAGLTGSHALSFNYKDAAGNVSQNSPELQITTSPEAVIVELIAPVMTTQTDTGTSQSDAITGNAKPTFSVGTLSNNAITQLLVDGVAVESTLTTLDNVSYLTPVNSLSNGKHAIAFTVQESSSNVVSTSPALDAVIMTDDTFILLNAATDDGVINATDAANNLIISGITNAPVGTTLTITGLDNVVRQATVEGAASNRSSNTFSVTIPRSEVANFSQGSHTVTVSMTDPLNRTSTDTQVIAVDTKSPNAPAALTVPENSDGHITVDEASNGTLIGVSLAGTNATAGDKINVSVDGVVTSYVLTSQDITNNTANVTVSKSVLEAAGQGSAVVTATITNAHGNTSVASPSTSIMLDAPNHLPTGKVIVAGIAQEGQVLTASNTLADADGMGTVSYKWYANGTEISGATGSSFVLGAAQVGKTISAKANYTDGQGTGEVVASNETGSVAALPAPPPPPVNTPAKFSGEDTGSVTEDATLTASGTLTVHDDDTGETAFQVPSNLNGTYGVFTFDNTNGQWTYALDNSRASVQALTAAGVAVTDTLVVKSVDGTTHDIKVTINGADEPVVPNTPATFGGVDTGSVTEDATPNTASGTLIVHDDDAGEATFQAPSNLNGTYGVFTFDNTNGQWTYALDNSRASVQALTAAGAAVTDTLVVKSFDGTTHDIKVTINGADEPVVPANHAATFGGDDTGSVTEDATPNTARGTLTVHDDDAGETVFQVPSNLNGTYGVFTFDNTNGQWTYALDNSRASVQALTAAGAAVTDTLVVKSFDGTTHDIKVTINGADEPVVPANHAATFGGDDTGSVTEDATPNTARGTLTVHDDDAGETAFQVPSNLNGTYGVFTFDNTNGQWTYALDNSRASVQALTAAGAAVTDTLVVKSFDGTTHDIKVTINGADEPVVPANHAATFGGDDTGSVTEDATPNTASGTLTVSDVDTGETAFQVPSNLNGTYGVFTFTAATGAWTYALDNSKASVQALTAAGAAVTDTLVVKSFDGTTHDIKVTINGADEPVVPANHAATFGGDDTGSVTEDATPNTARGTLTVHDDDAGETAFQVPSNLNGTYGVFTFDNTNGQWTYALDNSKATVQALTAAGVAVTDTLVVKSADGTTHDIKVTINGADEPNQAPTNTVPNAQTTNEDTSKIITRLQITDSDAGSSTMTVTLAVGHGVMTIASSTGVTITDNNTSNVQLTGALADINTLLLASNAVKYTPSSNYNGSDSLTMTTSDGLLSDSDSVAITVTPINDAPSITVNTPTTDIYENSAYSLTGIFSISDVDVGAGEMTASLNPNANVANGNSLEVHVGDSGVSIINNYPNAQSGYVYLKGTLSQLNALLAGNNNASIQLTITDGSPPPTTTMRLYVNDNGNTGAVAESTADIANFTVHNVNNAPVLDNLALTFVNTASLLSDKNGHSIIGMQMTNLTSHISDSDANSLKGIAITGAHHGTLYYIDSANANEWLAFNPTGNNQGKALLLDNTDSIYFKFVPESGYAGDITDAITFRAWDHTTGTNETYVDTSTNGGITAFSSSEGSVLVKSLVITSTIGAKTNDTTPTFSGQTEPNSEIDVYDDQGLLWGTTTANIAGQWEYTFGPDINHPDFGVMDETLSDATSYKFTFVEKSTSASQTVEFTVDTTFTPPIVLDLNQDGVLNYSQSMMDVNDDGQLEQTAWAEKEEGVLIWDKYADGQVHDNSQYAFAQYGGKTDLSGLAAKFDTNHDGTFNVQDAQFDEFAVWQDANQNGISDAGEVYKLSDIGMLSLNLNTDNVLRQPTAGVTEFGRTSAEFTNGSSMLITDAAFEYKTIKLDDVLQSPASNTMSLIVGGESLAVSPLAETYYPATSFYDVKIAQLMDDLVNYTM